jgi:hypothetical protein
VRSGGCQEKGERDGAMSDSHPRVQKGSQAVIGACVSVCVMWEWDV